MVIVSSWRGLKFISVLNYQIGCNMFLISTKCNALYAQVDKEGVHEMERHTREGMAR